MQLIFKFQVNRMKIDNFRNNLKIRPAVFLVDLMAYVELLTYDNLKSNRWLNSLTWYANPIQISSQSDEILGF